MEGAVGEGGRKYTDVVPSRHAPFAATLPLTNATFIAIIGRLLQRTHEGERCAKTNRRFSTRFGTKSA